MGSVPAALLLGLCALVWACHTPGKGPDIVPRTAPTPIAGDLSPLKEWFASATGAPRALALLSPT